MSLGLAILAGGLFSYGYLEATRDTTVVVAKTSVPMNSPVTTNELSTIQVPVAYARQIGALNQIQELAGKYLSVSIIPGQVITANMIASATDMQAVLNQYATNHQTQGVLMELPVKSVLAGMAQPGQNVALLVPGQGANGTPQLIAPVHILAVQQPPKTSGGLSITGGDSNATATLLVFVPDGQFGSVAPALINGQAQVVFYTGSPSFAVSSIQATSLPTKKS